MKTRMSILFVILSIFILAGCQTNNEDVPNIDDNEVPAENPVDDNDSQLVTYGVAGSITEITLSTTDNNLGTIFVEGDLETNGATYDKAYVTVTEDTVIYINEEMSFEDLAEGQYVEIFFEGAAMESYPVQATARQINVIVEPDMDEDTTEE